MLSKVISILLKNAEKEYINAVVRYKENSDEDYDQNFNTALNSAFLKLILFDLPLLSLWASEENYPSITVFFEEDSAELVIRPKNSDISTRILVDNSYKVRVL